MSDFRLMARKAVMQRLERLRAAAFSTGEHRTRKARGFLRRGIRGARALLQRANILSATGPVSGRREALLLTLIPLLTFGFVCIATSIAGVAYRPGCNSASNFVANLFFRPTKPSTCASVPFLSDIPTVILSLTCPFALVAYRMLWRRLSSLPTALADTGLLHQPGLTNELSRGLQRLESSVDMTASRRATLFVASTIMTTWLYTRNLADGHLFNILSKAGVDGSSNIAALRASWWANYHHHPFLAILCVSIGSIGVYYALRAGWLYFKLGAVLITTRKASAEALQLDYVPKWRDKSYGWSPVTGVLFLIYFSTVNFAVSMVAVFDMLQSKEWTLLVAVFFVTLGIVANLTIILSTFFRMLAAHKAVEERLRGTLTRGMREGSQELNPVEYAVAASDLSSWRQIPVSSFSGSAVKILPGLYAFIQFVRAFFSVKH